MIRHSILLGLLAALLQGCASTPEKEVKRPIWPAPPDEPRYQYETVLRLEDQFTGSGQGLLGALSGADMQPRQLFGKPFDIEAHNGVILVSDTVSRVVHYLHVPARMVFRVGAKDGPGKLLKPSGIGMDNAGNFYVADVSARRVLAFDALGVYKNEIGSPDDYLKPTDVAVSPAGDRVYVIDTGGVDSDKHRVLVYDAAGNQLSVIGTRGDKEGQFNLPVSADVDKDGNLYVLDAGNFRVQIFDRDGKFLNAWGKVGQTIGDLARPKGIAVDEDGLVYVTDAAFANVQVFDNKGRLMLAIGTGTVADEPGGYSLPAGVAADETGRLYVVEQRFNKVEVIKKLKPASEAK
ncbi:MAG: 6-bladed beta-propeller [Pseudomonadota bacterium]